jgi:cbb3-type cytochrome oxidase subunit 3
MAMSVFGMIIMWIFFIAILFTALNKGTMDKEANSRKTYWAKFEDK